MTAVFRSSRTEPVAMARIVVVYPTAFERETCAA